MQHLYFAYSYVLFQVSVILQMARSPEEKLKWRIARDMKKRDIYRTFIAEVSPSNEYRRGGNGRGNFEVPRRCQTQWTPQEHGLTPYPRSMRPTDRRVFSRSFNRFLKWFTRTLKKRKKTMVRTSLLIDISRKIVKLTKTPV